MKVIVENPTPVEEVRISIITVSGGVEIYAQWGTHAKTPFLRIGNDGVIQRLFVSENIPFKVKDDLVVVK